MSDALKRQNVVRRTPFPRSATTPLVPPLVSSAVFVARDADHMNSVYEGQEHGFTYAREGSPNADLLAAKTRGPRRRRRRADHLVGHVRRRGDPARPAQGRRSRAGERPAVRPHARGWSRQELPRLGFATDVADATDVAAFGRAIRPTTRLMLVEVVSNPLLRVVDIAALGGARQGARRAADRGQHVSDAADAPAAGARRACRVSQHHQDDRGAQRRDARRGVRRPGVVDADPGRDRDVGPQREPVRLLARRTRHQHAPPAGVTRQLECLGAGGGVRRASGRAPGVLPRACRSSRSRRRAASVWGPVRQHGDVRSARRPRRGQSVHARARLDPVRADAGRRRRRSSVTRPSRRIEA